jgi:predicted dehydrogenase
MASCGRILDAARRAGRKLCYAENWVYAPAVQKEREILVKSGGQILWILGEESHSGSHSPYYGIWKFAGGGSIVGKACHPLTAALYLKRAEGEARDAKPIRPATVSARTHEITRLKTYRDAGFLRTDYDDIEDFGQMHVTFSDGTVADIFSCELVLGGVHNWLEVFANNHRTRCNLNPVDALETYNAREEQLKDVYVVEKIGTKQGWSNPAPDEDWQHGYPQEFQDFMECIFSDREPLSGPELARDTVAVLYGAYVSAERRGAEVELPA